MQGVDLIFHYFPDLTAQQKAQFKELQSIYEDWNTKINVISRKDIDEFYERHVLHALAIAEVIQFEPGAQILDVGTGGGFPGIPLAILYPDVNFHLVDSIGKKIKVVQDVIDQLRLANVKAEQKRAEKIKNKYDFIISRAVTAMPRFLSWTRKLVLKEQKHDWPNGIFYLKGGDLEEEMADVPYDYEIIPISEFFDTPFFETKKIVYVNLSSN